MSVLIYAAAVAGALIAGWHLASVLGGNAARDRAQIASRPEPLFSRRSMSPR
jgi:hypothetical protein